MGSSSMQKIREGNILMNAEEMQEASNKAGQGRLEILMVTCQEPLGRQKDREAEFSRSQKYADEFQP